MEAKAAGGLRILTESQSISKLLIIYKRKNCDFTMEKPEVQHDQVMTNITRGLTSHVAHDLD